MCMSMFCHGHTSLSVTCFAKSGSFGTVLQVDTYGLCCIVHIMLHGSYMELETVLDANKRRTFRPKTPFKRFH